MVVKNNLIIVRYGEISLKSNYVRKKFENILIKNIKNALKSKEIDYEIKKERGRIFVYTININDSLKILKRIFGIVSFSPCVKIDSNIEDMSEIAISYAETNLKKDMSFAIRTKRTGEHSFTSQEVSIKIGNDIVENFKSKVDLTNPDYEIFIDIREKNTYIFDKKIKGPGGIPVGSQDKVLSIINDDFSLLSTWHLLSRGCKILFFVSKDFSLSKLESFCKNWFIKNNFLFFDENDDFYIKINEISKEKRCKAVVSSIYDLEKNVEDIKKFKRNIESPVLYPLISMDKEEINETIRNKGQGL